MRERNIENSVLGQLADGNIDDCAIGRLYDFRTKELALKWSL